MTDATGARARQSLICANLLCLLSVLAWCAGLPATKDLVAAIPPLPLSALRMGLAGAILGDAVGGAGGSGAAAPRRLM